MVSKEKVHRSKVCSQFVLHFLTPEQKQHHTDCCQDFIEICNLDPRILTSIVSGDKRWWSLQYNSLTKHQSSVWLSLGILKPQKVHNKNPLIAYFDAKGFVLCCKRVNSSRVCGFEWNHKCFLLREGPKMSQSLNSEHMTQVQGSWIMESVGTICPGIRWILLNTISLKIRSTDEPPLIRLIWHLPTTTYSSSLKCTWMIFWTRSHHSNFSHRAPSSHNFRRVSESLRIALQPHKYVYILGGGLCFITNFLLYFQNSRLFPNFLNR